MSSPSDSDISNDDSDYEDARQHSNNENNDGSPSPPRAPVPIVRNIENIDNQNVLQNPNPTNANANAHGPEVVIGEIQAEVNVNPNANNGPEVPPPAPGPRGINAHDIVRQVIDNLWPMLGPGNDYDMNEDMDDDGMENVQDGYFDEDENDQNESDDTNPPSNENEESTPTPQFDLELPTRHSYLGEGMEELQGRVVFMDEGPTPEIPLIVMGIQLVPGQTLPLTIFHAVFQNAIRRCVLNDRIFGIVHNDMEVPSGSMVYKGAFGTIAEIYEFQEETEHTPNGNPGMTTFALKAKGRQRFNVLNFRRQADGNLMGMVKIRPEIRLPPIVQGVMLEQTHRYRYPIKRHRPEPDPAASAHKLAKTLSLTSTSPSSTVGKSPREQHEEEDMEVVDAELNHMQERIREQRKMTKYYSAFTTFPYFVYEQYEETVLVEKVHRKLRVELKGLTGPGSIIPKDATELSFWLAQNLTMDDHHRIKILKMDSPVQRLTYELDLLSRACKVITCRYCQSTIADSSDIFSMSVEGPQGTYVNPHGFVHETLTLHKLKDVLLKGASSTEASWFPGYSWTVTECRRCSSHLGWKFKAVGRLTPPKFWGLARRSISFKYDFLTEENANDLNSNNQRASTGAPSAPDFPLAV